MDLPTLDDKATVVGAVGITFKEDTAQVVRLSSGLIDGKGLLTDIGAAMCLSRKQ